MDILRELFRPARAGLLLALALSLLVGIVAPSAASAQGQGDGRQVNPEAEYRAVVSHLLRREATSQEVKRDKQLTVEEKQCSWGVLENGYKIATSPEAGEVWAGDDAGRVDAMFRAFLDRPASGGDIDTYLGTIGSRGPNWTVASILASPEYRGRVAQICDGYNGDELKAAMYGWEPALAFAQENLVDRAKVLSVRCDFMNFIVDLNIRKLTGAKKFIGQVEKATDNFALDWDGACGSSLKMMQAAARIAEVATEGQGDNPVFIFHRRWVADGAVPVIQSNMFKRTETRVGPDPTNWKEYETEVKGLGHSDDDVLLSDDSDTWPPKR